MTSRLDLFATLGKIDRKSTGLYQELSIEEQKQIHPLVIMRWLSGSSKPGQLIMLNELVNPHVFTLGKQPDLLVDLMTVCTDGRPTRYNWIKVEKKQSKYPVCIDVLMRYYTFSSIKARQSLPALSDDAILEHAIDVGVQPDEMKKLKKELKERGKA